MKFQELLRGSKVTANTVELLHYCCAGRVNLTRAFLQMELGKRSETYTLPVHTLPQGISDLIPREFERVMCCVFKNVCKHPDIILDQVIRNEGQSRFLKRLQMCVGESWQVFAGGMSGWQDLGRGHPTGLDLRNLDRNIVMELKNSTQTDNSSSRTANFHKLQRFRNENGGTAIYGCINNHVKRIKTPDGVEFMSGDSLIEFLFGCHATSVKHMMIVLYQEVTRQATNHIKR